MPLKDGILFKINNNVNKLFKNKATIQASWGHHRILRNQMKNEAIDSSNLFQECRLCPRGCGTKRSEGTGQKSAGFCGETAQLKVAYVGPHFGEEPPLVGTHGSGTVFFSGCSLRCSYCQNFQISREGMGETLELEDLAEKVVDMTAAHSVHNVNFVTPDHFFPHVFRLISLLRREGCDLPMVFNTSGYQSISMLKMAEPFVDIYLPDFKYADSTLAARFSRCKDYPEVALKAISEMIRQKGFLDSFEKESLLATKGVLVRHLILPGYVENSVNVLTTLYLEFGARLPLSLMSQYKPVRHHQEENMNRPVTSEEFRKVYEHAIDLGFENLFVQFPGEGESREPNKAPFLPDFTKHKPFSGGHPQD